MFILIILSVLFVACLVFSTIDQRDNGWLFGGTIIFGILLGCFLLAFPIAYYDTKEGVANFNATKSTVASFRTNGDNYEKAALQMKVIESNQWLARVQYYRHTVWAMYIPKVVDELQPIK